jgi:peptidoglycan/LPS O-acetylase OafA/YrhL
MQKLPPPDSNNQRIIGLDYLRVALAICVFCYHSRIHIGCSYGILNDFFRSPTLAMVGFFVLSGYSLQIAYGNKDLLTKGRTKHFYLKRLVTIFPLYVIVGYMSVTMKIIAGTQTLADNVFLLPIELLGIQSFFNGSLFQYVHNGGTWFVSCILICYFIYPLIKELIKGCSRKMTTIAIVFIIVLLSYIHLLPNRFECGDLYTNAFLRSLEFIMGVLIAKVNLDNSGKVWIYRLLRSRGVLIASVVLLLFGVPDCMHNHIPSYLLIYTCLFFIFFSLGSLGAAVDTKWNKVLLYASGLTYAFFLCQVLVFDSIKFVIRQGYVLNNIVMISISFVLIVILSIIFHIVVEGKIGGLIKKKIL